MMKSLRALLCLVFLLAAPWAHPNRAVAQAVTLEGLRLSAHQGSFKAAHYAADGSLLLLYDSGDGLHVLKTDATARNVLAQAQLGAAGDVGLSMALDPAGNIYVAGTSTSGTLTGTPGVVFAQAADASTNSFVAKFAPDLHLVFLSFLGAGRTAVTGVTATADAVFVTGTTYNSSFPTTAGAAQSHMPAEPAANGFVQRLSPDGTALVYSTLLTGSAGDTNPSAIAADTADNAYIAGETSAADLPQVLPLQPTLLGTVSGFVSKLTPTGASFAFSTFVAGTGLTSVAIDSATSTVLLSGNVSLGQFPLGTVAGPIAATPYQTLLRLSDNGQNLTESVLLAPGASSAVTAGPHGTAWVSGNLSTPLSAFGGIGDTYLLHVAADGTIDQEQRFGGLPWLHAESATLTGTVAAAAISADGSTATLPLTLNATAPAPLAASQRWDIPRTGGPTQTLPDLPNSLLPASCDGLSVCNGSAGLLATLSTGSTGAGFSLSIDDLPNLVLRNTGSATATGLALTATGYTVVSNCGNGLLPLAECGILLTGAGPGSLTVTAGNAPTLTVPLGTNSASPNPLVLDASELDFGIVTSSSTSASRTVAVTNLSGAAQSFPSAPDGVPASPPYALSEVGSTCGGVAPTHTVAPSSTCTLTLALSASGTASNDGPVRAAWQIGERDIAITGITQAAALSLSATTVDFGVLLAGPPVRLPRYLYISNSSTEPYPHTPVSLPADSPFTVTDRCPTTLEPGSVCQLALTYLQTAVPSVDTVTLTLDGGLQALVTGTVLAPGAPPSPNPNLTVSASTFRFAAPVIVTELSSETGSISVTNSGATALPFGAAVAGDFLLTNPCGAVLAPGATCDLSMQFAPSEPGAREGLLQISTETASPPVLVTLAGTGAPLLLATNGSLPLGTTLVGEPSVAWYKIQAAIPNLTAVATGAAFGVAIVQDDGAGHGTLSASVFAPEVTAACANCWLAVAFLPQAVGPASGGLQLSTVPGGKPYLLALTGTGLPVAGLILSPGTGDFGTVPLGSTSAPLAFTLANLLTPAAAVEVAGVTVTGDFKLVPPTGAGASCSGSLASTASCSLDLSFTPTATGARTGTLTVQTTGGSVTIALTGSAVPDPGLGINPSSLTFNNSAPTQTGLTLTNNTDSLFTIASVTASDPRFTPQTTCKALPPGGSCSVTVAFAPGSDVASATLTVSAFSAAAGNNHPIRLFVPLAATYTSDETGLVLLPAEADFGAEIAGDLGQTRQFTVWNTSSSPETIALSIPQQFPLATPPVCGTVAPGGSCTFSVSFVPETGGAITGSLLATAVSSSGTHAQAIGYLQGYRTASGKLTLSGQLIPGAPVNFGEVASGQTAQQTLTFTNAGTGPLTIRRLLSAPPFLASTSCGRTLAPGASCTATLTYAPLYELPTTATSLAPRADSETLILESDAASSPDQVELTGIALPAIANGSPTPPQLASYTLSQGALTFPNTQVGNTSAPQTITVLNTGTATLKFGAIQTSPDYTATTACITLVPGATCTLTVAFAPSQHMATALRSGTLTLQSNATDALQFVSLLGLSSPAPLALSPISVDFGTVSLGKTAKLPITVTNTALLPITFTTIAVTGGYTVAPGTCPAPGNLLAAGQSCALVVSFAPAVTGARTGTLSLATNATESPLTSALTGIGIAPKLQISPSNLAFGNVKLGATTTLTLNLVNSGSDTLSGLTATISGPNTFDFRLATPCPTNSYTPLAGCTLQVMFSPSGVGSRAATLTFTSSDPAGPTLIPLSGTGTPASGFTLTVNGLTTATATVPMGASASFPLTLTPQGGFTGLVALTCTPVTPASYAACHLPGGQVTLGSGPQTFTTAITTLGPVLTTAFWPWNLLLLTPLACTLRKRRRLQKLRHPALLVLASLAFLYSAGCGSPGSSRGENLTPAGTYQYVVTATSTVSPQNTSSVTLNLNVQ